MKAVLLHGYNVFARNFEEVFWGIPEQGLMGRGPTALWIAMKDPMPSFLLFGAGIPVKDGLAQSQIERDFLRGNRLKLRDFRNDRAVLSRMMDMENFMNLFGSEVDLSSRSTAETTAWAKEIIKRQTKTEANELVVVSDPAHLPRALSVAFQVFHGTNTRISAVASDIPYAKGKSVVIEPPLLKYIGPELNALISRGIERLGAEGGSAAKIVGEEVINKVPAR